MPPVASLAPAFDAPSLATSSLAPIQDVIKTHLIPKVLDVDLNAEYPEIFMRELGKVGGFAGAVSPEYGGNTEGMRHVIQVMELVARECLSSAFLVWCQTACARYIQMSNNSALKSAYLHKISRGEQLAGTGLSNTVKSCDSIEEFRLTAKRVDGGYVINGVLPWVSNLGPTHVFATGCPVLGEDQKLVFILVDCSQPGFKLVDCAHFVALDGTRTLACHFKETFIPDERVLAHPHESDDYVKRIKPGMILAQMGMGLGLIEACCKMMHQSNKSLSHVNQYLDDQVDDIEERLSEAQTSAYTLADTLNGHSGFEHILEILKLRLAGGELSLKAANAAMLHQGAKGYLLKSPAQRRLREAYFVAIVTPATKHLRREIARLESGQACSVM